MGGTQTLRTAVGTLILLLVLAAGTPSAFAAAPANDKIRNATVVGSLPFTFTENTVDATFSSNDPTDCLFPDEQFAQASVWFVFTPTATSTIELTTKASYSDVVAVYQGSVMPGNLNTCSTRYDGTAGSTFQADAGKTYRIMIAAQQFGGKLTGKFEQPPPPANDDFANATQVASVPFDDPIDMANATVESGEPHSSCESNLQSAWYRYTPGSSDTLHVFVTAGDTSLAAYMGSSLGGLTEVACKMSNPYPIELSFSVTGGTTYYIQVGDRTGVGDRLVTKFTLGDAIDASFTFTPANPHIGSQVVLTDTSFEPLGQPFTSESWDLGDGTSDSGPIVGHTFAADGTYSVKLTVNTGDGRSASASASIAVVTHDVVVKSVKAPARAKVGATRTITAKVTARVYTEQVEVLLYRHEPGGNISLVGTLTKDVSGALGFRFSYRFARQDIPKVTFKAVARIVGAKDANPRNNVGYAHVSVS